MDFNKQKKIKETMAGYDEQEKLIDMMSSSIANIVEMNASTLRLSVDQALNDALKKRDAAFKDIKFVSQNEKTEFVNDLVIQTVKRAKLVGSVDEIVEECNKVYDEWKIKYRPEEVGK